MMIPLKFAPGVCRVDSDYASKGRYNDMDGVRFIAGKPEKIGGWTTALGTAVPGTPRGLKDFRDYSQNSYLSIGTTSKLLYLLNGTLTDITPWRAIKTGTLSSPLTTNGTTTVSVAHTSHGLSTGDYVMLVTGSVIDGIQPTGVFNPITKTDANNYTFVNTSAATGSTSGGGGTVTYTYYRITLSSPLSVIISTPTVTVAHTAHGATVGDYVTISGTTAIGGITPTGEVQVASVVDANTWTFIWTSNATSTVNNAGGSPNFQYDINVGTVDASTVSGYGNGGYGTGGYGQNSAVGITVPPRVWALSRYGQQLYASPINGTIYVWDPTITGRAYPLYGAPTNILWMFVTPERFVFALGSSTSNLMKVQWPDQSDPTAWTALATNTANSRTLQEGSYLIGGISPRDSVSLVFSNTGCYTFSYTGDNNVYASQLASRGGNLISPLALVSMNGSAYWMSDDEFYMWNGAVMPLPSDDIRDFVFNNLNRAQSYKFCAGTNIAKKEVIFFYVSSSSNEIDKYVTYHIDQNCFSIGTVLKRTSWIDRDLFSTPMAVDASGYIYNQEAGNDANGMNLDAYVTFGPLDAEDGAKNLDIFGFIPDFERQTGNCQITVQIQNNPNDPITNYGPYNLGTNTGRLDLRIGGKLVGGKLESNTLGGDFRWGLPRVEAQESGARR